MYEGIECQIYPNRRQADMIQKTFGHTRFVWNQMLGMLNERYRNNKDLKMLSYSTLSSLIPQLKREYEWLKEVDSVAVQCAVKTLSETSNASSKDNAVILNSNPKNSIENLI